MRISRPKWSSVARFLIGCVLIYIALRLFVYDVYFIRSSSMRSTLYEGDYILVNKFFLNDVDRYDVFVFLPPATDSTLTEADYYIKRCVGLPGDTVSISNGILKVNDIQATIPTLQFNFSVLTNGTALSPSLKKRVGAEENIQLPGNRAQSLYMTLAAADSIRETKGVLSVTMMLDDPGYCDENIFPKNNDLCWNLDNLGPVIVPRKGMKIKMDPKNASIYGNIIRIYEGKPVEVNGSIVSIAGKNVLEYEFTLDYYFAMGDNRHFSSDSRSWGFLPSTNVSGTASMILWSSDPETESMRGNRMFSIIH